MAGGSLSKKIAMKSPSPYHQVFLDFGRELSSHCPSAWGSFLLGLASSRFLPLHLPHPSLHSQNKRRTKIWSTGTTALSSGPSPSYKFNPPLIAARIAVFNLVPFFSLVLSHPTAGAAWKSPGSISKGQQDWIFPILLRTPELPLKMGVN